MLPTAVETDRMTRFALMMALALAAGAAHAETCRTNAGGGEPARPDWRDQVVYFLVIDRFDDGDASNNDQGAGEYDPSDAARFSGGDLVGACRRLDYIQGLGATAVWITPPVANQWWDGQVGYGGYHGYWAADFMAVDAHFGTLDDYRRFAAALHARGMSLVQDVVVNHTGNFFRYDEAHNPADPVAGYSRNRDSRPMPAPLRAPFHLNDPRRAEDRAAGIYHWTPRIRDFGDRRQELDYALADLDDLDTENPVVRRALRESYGFWIREVGVDAFRVDTAFHVPPDYFRDFLYSDDPRHPGMMTVARQAGRDGFHVFGEGFGLDRPFQDTIARKIESYVRDDDGPLLPGMINFPLYGGLGDVFGRGRPTAELAHRIRATMAVHADPHRMPTFLDNHDVDRFLAGGSEAALRQGLLALMTLPGIPVLYYGTEQGLRERRASLFAGGYGSGGRDRFDTQSPLYRYVADVVGLRRGHRLFSRGRPTVLREDAAGAGVLAYRVDHEGERALVVFNTADEERLVDNLDTGLPPGRRLELLFSARDDAAPDAALDARGHLSLRLPARSGLAWTVGETGGAQGADVATPLRLDPLPDTPLRGVIAVSGQAPPGTRLQLLVDGRLADPTPATADADGRWQARLDPRGRVDPAVRHRVVAWVEREGWVSEGRGFRVDPDWRLAAEQDDPAGDDRGPGGRYEYPADAGWREARPGDLRGVRASVSGGSLQLELRMARLMAGWNPPNGFDHVNFTVFLELPDRAGGARVMPLQSDELPAGMRWHYRWRVGGWSSAVFSAEGASATQEGTATAPAPQVAVDRDRQTVVLTIPAQALGSPASLAGGRLYVTTWDYDDGYRPLLPEADGHRFGGGSASDPKWLDASDVLVLRPAN